MVVEVRRRHRIHRRSRHPSNEAAKPEPEKPHAIGAPSPPGVGSKSAVPQASGRLPLPAFPAASAGSPDSVTPDAQKPPPPPELPTASAQSPAKNAAPDAPSKPAEVYGPPAPPSLSLATPEEPSKPTEVYGPPPPPIAWPAAEVEAGRRDCERRLSGLGLVFERLDPLREGACGAPAAIRLKSLKEKIAPDVAFAPAPTITCQLGEAMRRWFDEVVQPKAKEHLNATIVRVGAASGYDCRARNGGSSQRISQHAYANALDLGDFVTARGEKIALTEHWDAEDERGDFLRDIHAGACRIFGTTLGPEANEAHRNHFHLDMTERRTPLCDFTGEQARAMAAQRKADALAAKQALAPVPLGGDAQASGKPVVYGPPPPPVPAVVPPAVSEKVARQVSAPVPAVSSATKEGSGPKADEAKTSEEARVRKAVEKRRKPIRRRARLPFGIRF